MHQVQPRNYGLHIEEKDEGAYVLGGISSLPKVVLQQDGQWDEYLPEYEPQAEFFETSGCTVWGTQNAIEILYKRLFENEPNYSERFNYILTPVTLQGADPHRTCECIRKQGLIDYITLPMVGTYDEFITPDPMTGSLLARGQNWLVNYDFGHEYVFAGEISTKDRMEKMKQALRYSPLGVAVSAWYVGPNGTYVDMGLRNNHWCVVYGWNKNGWKCFDSYDHSKKTLSFDHNITVVKRFYLAKKEQVKNPNWLKDIFKGILQLCITLLTFKHGK